MSRPTSRLPSRATASSAAASATDIAMASARAATELLARRSTRAVATSVSFSLADDDEYSESKSDNEEAERAARTARHSPPPAASPPQRPAPQARLPVTPDAPRPTGRRELAEDVAPMEDVAEAAGDAGNGVAPQPANFGLHSNVAPPRTRVHIYCRVSTEKQDEGGMSLAAQQERCRVHAEERGWTVASYTREVGSAFYPKLPRLRALLEGIAPHEILLVSNYDRFSRDTVTGVTMMRALAKHGVRVVAVQEPGDTLTPAGKYSFTMIVAAGEFNSANTGHKIKATIRKRKAEGFYYGNPGYGYGVEREYDGERLTKRVRVVNQREQDVIALVNYLRQGGTSAEATRLMYKVCPAEDQQPIVFDDDDHTYDWFVAGELSFDSIAELLNSYHVPYRHGDWTANVVRRIAGQADADVRAVVRGIGAL